MTDQASGGTPQFTTAEYAKSAEANCKSCRAPLSDPYYLVNGAPTCADCTRRIEQEAPQDSQGAFVRGVLFGIGAALVGCILYVVVALTTGLVIGFVSLAVGYLVGKAVMSGSRGIGGRRYQIAAVLLTYAAVSLANVPIAIAVHMKHSNDHQAARVSSPMTPSHSSAAPTDSPAALTDSPAAPTSSPATPAQPEMSAAQAIGTLALVGLASPFLALSDPAHGIIGLIILLVGLRIAWRLTGVKPLHVSGPEPKRSSAASG